MNKLDVALKLLRLLNERKNLDSRIVAHELCVSLRTAQRYLLELSGLPCVITDEKEHTYCLAPDYSLKGALLTAHQREDPLPEVPRNFTEAVCTLCRTAGNNPSEFPCVPTNGVPRDNRQQINRLASLLRRTLKDRKHRFP